MKYLAEVVEIEYIFRILLGGICGMMIGIERKNRSKNAGTRTHFIVACGASLIMVVSKYAFFDVISKGLCNGAEVRLDPSRVSSTIASGIGFLGAGMIFVHKNTITGLTTAAGIWATSGVGMAIGAGMYAVGIASTVIIIVAQLILHLRSNDSKQLNQKRVIIKEVQNQDYLKYIVGIFQNKDIRVVDVNIEKVGDYKNYILMLEYPDFINEDEIVSIIDYDCLLKT